MCFILYPKYKQEEPSSDDQEEELERKQVKQFNDLLRWHDNLVFVHLKYIHDLNPSNTTQSQVTVGTFQFNYMFTN